MAWERRSSQLRKDNNSMRQLEERSEGGKLIPVHVPSVEPANYLFVAQSRGLGPWKSEI